MLKLMVVARGISGSGKSFLVNKKYPDAVILSTDDIFMSRGSNPEYLWSIEGLGIAHTLNKIKCEEACARSIPVIVIDNTNLKWWEIKPYVEIAKEFGYTIEVIEPNNDWSKDSIKCYKRNQHGVPLEVIERQLKNAESLDSILEKINALMAR